MTQCMERFFSPCITLRVKGGIYLVDNVHQFQLVKLFKTEAGINGSINEKNYDDFRAAAGKRGYAVETIGE